MTSYTYAKYIDVADLLEDIQRSSLGVYLDSITNSGTTITINMKHILSAHEERLLKQIITAHIPIDPRVAATKIKVTSAMLFGQSLIAEYAAMNTLAKVPTVALSQIIVVFAPLQSALQTGSLYTALELINKLPSSPYLSDKTKAYFSNKIKKYLGLPLL